MTDGTQMTKEQVEAFGLGKTLGEMSVSLGHIGKDVLEVKKTTGDMASDVTQIRLTLVEHAGQIKKNSDDIRELKEAPQPEYATRAEHEQLRLEVAGSRLTWPKLLAGAGALVAGAALLLNWAAALGAFK